MKRENTLSRMSPEIPNLETKITSIFDWKYKKISKLGEGTYGVVYKCIDTITQKKVAIKKIKCFDPTQGIPSTTLKEISILRECSHPNIVRLEKIEHEDGQRKLYLVFEMLEMDLGTFLRQNWRNKMLEEVAKKILYEILKGLDYLHCNRILHRDLKPDNILLDKNLKRIKLADFGLSRTVQQPMRLYSKEILTLWYRAPEICMGRQDYSFGVDSWAVGCIMAEIFRGKPIFQGQSDSEQLMIIFKNLGTPDEKIWPGLVKYKSFTPKFPKFEKKKVRDLFPEINDEDGWDLLEKLLSLDPNSRICAKEALNHEYFTKSFYN